MGSVPKTDKHIITIVVPQHQLLDSLGIPVYNDHTIDANYQGIYHYGNTILSGQTSTFNITSQDYFSCITEFYIMV